MRPATLAQVAELATRGGSFDRSLANFLDELYSAPSASALAQEPVSLAPSFADLGRVQDAYLAAAAEELARQFNLQRPTWIDAEIRKLHRPWFASKLATLRAVLLLESPAAFRSRNLFVSENALVRV
jgi:hypothetical protein